MLMAMKTTLDLPDELVREIKVKAAREGRKLKDAVADLLRAGLAAGKAKATARAARKKNQRLPLVKCRHAATPATEMTPERIADVLLRQEASWHAETGR
jgi:plasmid stability protein